MLNVSKRSITALTMLAGTTLGVAFFGWPGAADAVTSAQKYNCSKTYYSGTALTEEGDTGNRVIEAQCQLYSRGYLNPGQVDGVFGNTTYRSVLRFQREFDTICHGGISIDGVVGEYTWAALRSPCPS